MKQIFLFLCFCVNFLVAQQTEYVDFKTADVNINLMDIFHKSVSGKIIYEFDILKDIDSIFFDARNFESVQFTLDDTFTDSLYNGKQLIVKQHFKANSKHRIKILWNTSPKKALYHINYLDDKFNQQIWTQGQGKYTSNWLPSIDDMNEKIEFDLKVLFHSDYEVISNGKLKNQVIYPDAIEWHYDMQQPMPSYLVALAIGKYDKKVEYSKSGIPLEMYYYPEDSLKFEPTYRYTKQMFDFLEEEIGVPYPWQNYKMVPVKDFLYAGMENTSLNIYSDAFVVDSIAFVDKNFVNINAHELAHQWFGNLVTATSGTHHWLQEGFATYYALLAEKEIFGDDYYYWRLYEYAQELKAQDEAGKSTSLLDPKSSSTTFYKKGCWVLHMLREKVGDEAFRKAVQTYLEKYQFKNVVTNDFISEVEKSSGKDLSKFIDDWLINEELLIHEMNSSLEENEMSDFLITVDNTPFLSFRKDNDDNYVPSSVVTSLPEVYHPVNTAIVKELLQKPSYPTYDDLLSDAFQNEDLKVRQAITQNLSDIPSELKEDYESLLNDKSYITVETALFNLWNNFPEDRTKYLNQTKSTIGFNDKNVRILWLTLVLITEDYEPDNKSKYFQELTDYTSSQYGFEVRQNAFQYLDQIQACNDECKDNLKQATSHHNWRFKQFAKSLLEKK